MSLDIKYIARYIMCIRRDIESLLHDISMKIIFSNQTINLRAELKMVTTGNIKTVIGQKAVGPKKQQKPIFKPFRYTFPQVHTKQVSRRQ
jgi:hypothetical protein